MLSKSHLIVKTLVQKIAKFLVVLQKYNLIHADLNPENILLYFDKDNKVLQDIRVIDFGSSLHFHEIENITAVTPEYLPPEVL